jgi:hypothetical protein
MPSAELARGAAIAVGVFQVLANGALLVRGDALAQVLGLAIAAYYLVLGIATFSFAPGRQWGLLVFSLLGIVLGATVLLSKARL